MAYKHFILVCGGTGCESSHADEIYRELIANAEAMGVKNDVQVVKTGCFGFCEKGPIVKVLPSESFYVEVKPSDAKEIIAEQIVKGREVTRLLYKDERQKDRIKLENIQFYQKQYRIVLRNCGVINPENIDEYIARDGYAAIEKVLTSMKPEDVVAELKASGLRGRGGAGFPTWRKWEFSKGTVADQKYVVCNADEGDPGAYMDRSTVEGDPHSVIEAMSICGYTVGATKGFIYIRAEYPLAIERLKIGLKQAREYGLLGDNILGTDFCFDIEIRLGAGAFVCGEETALLQSIEGNRGMPVPRPPFPAIKGLWGKPTVINNVETWANIPVIITKGAAWFSKIGTETSKGTKVFALTGKINNSGLVEVPMGTTLREIIYDIGGGIRDGKKFKGAQTGGPSGGIITEEFLDLPIDYESLTSLGSMMGSGGLISHGRGRLRRRRVALLHGVLRRRIVRQVLAMPHRHQPDAFAARQVHQGTGQARRPRKTREDRAGDEEGRPLRPRSDSPEPFLNCTPQRTHSPWYAGRSSSFAIRLWRMRLAITRGL